MCLAIVSNRLLKWDQVRKFAWGTYTHPAQAYLCLDKDGILIARCGVELSCCGLLVLADGFMGSNRQVQNREGWNSPLLTLTLLLGTGAAVAIFSQFGDQAGFRDWSDPSVAQRLQNGTWPAPRRERTCPTSIGCATQAESSFVQ
ncbi:unnamed protein product [Protopolystoma xenopodis]|uniref:Uncharacterized protein n=1 Tax=Protopolystoma xenopodis TaxID=117903 RepID=A0A3S5APM9_9PLAT|nr:unnamed protein product [Protopolystoma xenopodis]